MGGFRGGGCSRRDSVAVRSVVRCFSTRTIRTNTPRQRQNHNPFDPTCAHTFFKVEKKNKVKLHIKENTAREITTNSFYVNIVAVKHSSL